MSKISNTKAKLGRPAKMSLNEKKMILHRFMNFPGSESYSASHLHGIYSKLANFARQSGYATAESYDFANDQAFKDYLNEYLLAAQERSRSQRNTEFGFETLDIGSVLRLSERELRDVLQQREDYFKNLYSSAINAYENYNTLENENRALKEESQHLIQEIAGYTAKIDSLEHDILMLKQDVRSAKEAAAYYQARAKDVISIEAQHASKNPTSLLGEETRISSLVSKDLEMRKASKDSPTVISFMDKLEEKLKESTNDEQ